MRLWDQKGVRVGIKWAASISSHFCQDHQQTPLQRVSPKLGLGRVQGATLPGSGRGSGQGAGLLLADWAGAPCPLPWPFLGPDSGVGPSPCCLGVARTEACTGTNWDPGASVGRAGEEEVGSVCGEAGEERGKLEREREGEERGRLQGWVATRKEVSSGACPRDAKPRAWVWQEGDPGKKDGHFAEHRWTKALKDKASGLHATPFSPAPR